MFGFRWKTYQWLHVAVAGGSVGLSGCVDRAWDFGGSGSSLDDSGTDSDGPDPTGGPGDPSNPTDPTDPTVGPGDPPLPGIPGAPKLIDVQFLDNLTLQLAFNEPMASPDAVDPTAFRLSLGQGGNFEPYYDYYGYYGYKWTFYSDPRFYNGEEVCTQYCWDYCYKYYDPNCYDGTYCYEWCYSSPGAPVTAFQLTLDPNNPSVMQLRFDNGIGAGVCGRTSPYTPGDEYVQGLFLHYTDSYTPVYDSQGEALAPISETWALQPQIDNSYEPGVFFPRMDPFLPIPCPF